MVTQTHAGCDPLVGKLQREIQKLLQDGKREAYANEIQRLTLEKRIQVLEHNLIEVMSENLTLISELQGGDGI